MPCGVYEDWAVGPGGMVSRLTIPDGEPQFGWDEIGAGAKSGPSSQDMILLRLTALGVPLTLLDTEIAVLSSRSILISVNRVRIRGTS